MFRLLEALVDPFAPAKRGTPSDRFWPFLFGHLRPYRHVLGPATLTGLTVALVEVGLVFYAGRLVDLIAASTPETFLARHGIELALVVLAVLVVKPVAVAINIGLLHHGLSTNLMDQVWWRAHRHLLGQSVGVHQDDFAGRVANRVIQTGPAVEDTVFMAFEALWHATAYVIAVAIVLGSIDLRLMPPIALWLIAYVWILYRLVPRVGKASERMSDARSTVTGRVVDAYTNIQTVKLFAHAEREEAYARSAMARHRLRFARLLRLMTTMIVSLAGLSGAVIVVTVGTAVWLWHTGSASVGMVATAAALTLRLDGLTGWIMFVATHLFQHAGTIREGLETISKPHAVTDAPDATALRVAGGAIRFEGVVHRYGRPEGEAGGLSGVDLAIAPGERIGLVGRSGAGKSTLVNLLLRFHDVEGGRILIDGQDIARVTQTSLRRAIAVVTQDTALLHRSVRENILYGRPDATEAEMRAAASAVAAEAFIDELRDGAGRRGYDALVGERGVKLSGGQRQRIALARAVLKDAPILILDEATSALDSEAEAAIQAALEGLMEGRTVIAIAHRLSTIQRMDRIVVMDAGRVAETGPHETLLATGGLYAGLWARQSGGFLGTQVEGRVAGE